MKLKVLIACALALTLAVAPTVAKGKKSHAKTSNTQVIYTGDLGKKIYGYNGTTPLNITQVNIVEMTEHSFSYIVDSLFVVSD